MLAQLGDHQHLRREKALTRITQMLEAQAEPAEQSWLEQRQLIMIAFYKQMFQSRRWEDRFGAINGVLATIHTTSEAQYADLESFLWEFILHKSFP